MLASYLAVAMIGATAFARVLHRQSLDSVVGIVRPAYLVLMVLDGGRPDYFGLAPLPHVDALRAAGTQYTNAIDGILETETPSGHTTLATGSTPRRNGILGFNWAQNDNDYSLFSPDVVRAGAMEHIMEAAGVPTIAGLYKARYPKAKVVALSGHKYYAADPLGGPKADAIMYFQGDPQGHYVPVAIPGHMPPPGVLNAPGLTRNTIRLPDGTDDGLATSLALASVKVMRPRVLLINYPEFDWPLGHVYGGNANRAKVVNLMRSFDSDLGKIEGAYRQAGILDKTLFVITDDHGMTPINRYVPQTVLSNAVLRAGTTAPSVANSSGGYVWLRDPTKAQVVAQNVLATNDPGIESVYYLTSVGGRLQYVPANASSLPPAVDAMNQYLLATLLNGHEPTVVVFCRSNATFASPDTHWKADHGGAGWQSQHIPLIFSGPGIRSGIVTDLPAQLDDVAPTALTAMGVPPTGMEGRVLTEAIQTASTTDQSARKREIDTISGLLYALTTQDRTESVRRSQQ